MSDQAPEPLADTLRRLKAERDLADARYNDALTALDRALVPAIDLPPPPPLVDDQQVTPLNAAWNTLVPPPGEERGWRGRLARFIIARTVGPYLERQQTFNSLLVDHINRNAVRLSEAHRVAEAGHALLRNHLNAIASFHALQMLFLQHVTGYIDTKDRDSAGATLVLNASFSGLAESIAKRWESLSVRDGRYASRTDALEARQEDLRTMIGVAQQAIVTLKREMERVGAPSPAVASPGAGTPEPAAHDAFAPSLDAYKYVGFEDRFRGSRDVIRARFESYMPLFESARTRTTGGDVLDIGCGRGEFLDLLTARGIPARGIDLNHEMAEVCRARGLNVAEADAVGYLTSLPDASLAGLFSAQVVEHLQPGYLLRLLELARHKLQPGGRLVLETLNPACWVAFFESYIRDITHVWPLHPETLKYLVTASGFSRVDIEFRSPVPTEDRLQMLAMPQTADATLSDLADAFNANVEKLNLRLFTFMDYAVIAER